MKTCPFCAEEIQDAAVKCRYCQTVLSESAPARTATSVAPRPSAASKSPTSGNGCLGSVGIAFVSLVICYLAVQPFLTGVFQSIAAREAAAWTTRLAETGDTETSKRELAQTSNPADRAFTWSAVAFVVITLVGIGIVQPGKPKS